MSGSTKADLVLTAGSTVITVDQLMKAIEASHEGKNDHAKKHLGYAAIGAAVAVGSMELLRRDEMNKEHEGSDSEDDVKTIKYDPQHPCHRYRPEHHHTDIVKVSPRSGRDHEPHGHKRRLAEEIAGAYALGEEIMGHKKHHVSHVVAEVLGAVAAMKDAGDHIKGME